IEIAKLYFPNLNSPDFISSINIIKMEIYDKNYDDKKQINNSKKNNNNITDNSDNSYNSYTSLTNDIENKDDNIKSSDKNIINIENMRDANYVFDLLESH